MADRDSTLHCSCCALGVQHGFVVLSVTPPDDPLAAFARRLAGLDTRPALAQLRRARDHQR